MTRICTNIANDDANKNKLKVQNSKLKITTQKSKVMSLRGAERRSNLYRLIASLRVPKHRRTKQSQR
jgi:hypothetical protein